MTVRVLSFDFDGCLFNSQYQGYYNEEEFKSNPDYTKKVLKANFYFLSDLAQQAGNYDESFVFVGSCRQSYRVDRINSNKRGSCFPAIKHVSNYLNARLDPFLLADVFGDLDDGVSMQRALKPEQKEHADWIFDQSKVTILYAQMHKAALQNPDKPIVFDFYDNEDLLLEALYVFYSQNTDLIPANLTLKLHAYPQADNSPYPPIEGKGMIDKNYRQTVKDMAVQVQLLTPNSSAINVAEKLQPELLKNRISYFHQNNLPEDDPFNVLAAVCAEKKDEQVKVPGKKRKEPCESKDVEEKEATKAWAGASSIQVSTPAFFKPIAQEQAASAAAVSSTPRSP